MSIVEELSLNEVTKFLRQYEEYSFFLLGNLEAHGHFLTEHPFSGNFKMIKSGKEIVAVFCLTASGTLLVQSERDDVFDLILDACKDEPMSIRSVIGEWTFSQKLWNYLKSKNLIQKETYIAKEVLYSLDLSDYVPVPQVNARLLSEGDFEKWYKAHCDYCEESKIPSTLSEEQIKLEFLFKVMSETLWGLFLGDELVSIGGLNTKAFDLGVVGGVYTAPQYRRRGFGESLMRDIMNDALLIHQLAKLIIFTSVDNIPARGLYKDLDAEEIGYYALLFGE